MRNCAAYLVIRRCGVFCLFFIPIATLAAVEKVLIVKASLYCRVEVFCVSLSTCIIPGVMDISLNLSFFSFLSLLFSVDLLHVLSSHLVCMLLNTIAGFFRSESVRQALGRRWTNLSGSFSPLGNAKRMVHFFVMGGREEGRGLNFTRFSIIAVA